MNLLIWGLAILAFAMGGPVFGMLCVIAILLLAIFGSIK